MKWSKRSSRKTKSPTQTALLELASTMRTMRLHGQPTSQEMEAEYRQLLAKNYEEKAQERA
jgi:hypothetical protein